MNFEVTIIGGIGDKMPHGGDTLRPIGSISDLLITDIHGTPVTPSGNSNIAGQYHVGRISTGESIGRPLLLSDKNPILVMTGRDFPFRALAYDAARLCTYIRQKTNNAIWSDRAKALIKKTKEIYDLPSFLDFLPGLDNHPSWEDLFTIMQNSTERGVGLDVQIQTLTTRYRTINLLMEEYAQLQEIIKNIQNALSSRSQNQLQQNLDALSKKFAPQKQEDFNKHNTRLRRLLDQYYLIHKTEIESRAVECCLDGRCINKRGGKTGEICQCNIYKKVTVDDIMNLGESTHQRKERELLFLKMNGINIGDIRGILYGWKCS